MEEWRFEPTCFEFDNCTFFHELPKGSLMGVMKLDASQDFTHLSISS